MYADDLLLFKPISCQQDLSSFQRDVNLICQWTLQNHLFLNWDKTKCMLIFRGRPGSCNYFNFPIYVNNNQFERIHQYKYLGVWISDDLKHIESICNRSQRSLGYIFRTFSPYCSPDSPFSIYTRLRCYPFWTMPAYSPQEGPTASGESPTACSVLELQQNPGLRIRLPCFPVSTSHH